MRDWGFNRHDTEKDLGGICESIQDDTDILISNGPPFGINDYVDYPLNSHAGSKQLLKRIFEIKPKLVVTGHLHDDRNYGIVEDLGMKFVGCSLADEMCQVNRKPLTVEI